MFVYCRSERMIALSADYLAYKSFAIDAKMMRFCLEFGGKFIVFVVCCFFYRVRENTLDFLHHLCCFPIIFYLYSLIFQCVQFIYHRCVRRRSIT